MADNKEDTGRMDGSEGNPEKPHSGDEIAAAAEDLAKTSEKMAAIVVQIKGLENKLEILS